MSDHSPPANLTGDEAERRLGGLDAAHGEISGAMFGIDSHPVYQLLGTGGMSGATGRLWDDIQPTVEVLWAQFTVLRELRERAQELHERGRALRERRPGRDCAEWSELEMLLCEPVVGVDGRGMPTAGTGTPPRTRLTVTELIERLRASARSVTERLQRVADAQRSLTRRLAEARTGLDEVRTLADGLGTGTDLEQVTGDLDTLQHRAIDDPLGLAEDTADATLHRLATQLDRARQRLRQLERFRADAQRQVAELRTWLDEVAALTERVERAYRTVQTKIAAAGLPPAETDLAALRDRLAEVTRTVAAGQWPTAAAAAGALRDELAAEHDRQAQLLRAATGLLERRVELRGLLRAYQAKAARLGVVEATELTARHARASQLLRTSPCDLRAATVAVRAYQEAVARLADEGGRPE